MSKGKKGKGNLSVLMNFAGRHRFLTYTSWVLSGIRALLALTPFVFIWLIIRDVIWAGGNYSGLSDLIYYGWMAVGSALLSMVIYFAALMCSHIAAFRVASNMRKRTMPERSGGHEQ